MAASPGSDFRIVPDPPRRGEDLQVVYDGPERVVYFQVDRMRARPIYRKLRGQPMTFTIDGSWLTVGTYFLLTTKKKLPGFLIRKIAE